MMTNSVSRQIAAPPEKVWALVSDLTRMAEWSPRIERSEWTDGATGPKVGARFVGHVHQGPARYSRQCEITALEPGREVAFQTFIKGAPSVRWRYLFEPSGDGTKMTESYEIFTMPMFVNLMMKIPAMAEKNAKGTREAMALTLDRIAAIAES